MKLSRLIILIGILLLGQGTLSEAANTDVSKYPYCIYINPTTTASGTQLVLSLCLNNTGPISSYQCDVTLPEGFSFAVDADGMVISDMTTTRTSSKKHNGYNVNIQKTGALRILCFSTVQDPETKLPCTFTGNEGQVSTITVNVDKNVAAGVYPVVVTGVVLSDANGKAYKVSDPVESDITVTGPAFDGVTLDENSTTAPTASDGATNVKVKRTLKANEWSTLCLPFAMTGEQVTSAFGSDVKIGDFSNWTEEYASDADEYPSTINVEFTSVAATAGLEANHPYIIKTSSDITEFTADGVTIAPETEPAVTVGSKRKGTLGSFTGNYVAGILVPEANLFLTDNAFWYSVGKTKIKAFRGFFELYDVTKYYQENSGSTGAKVNIVMDGNTTGISTTRNDSMQDSRVYTISGTMVSKDMKALPHGVYIVNGKKIVK